MLRAKVLRECVIVAAAVLGGATILAAGSDPHLQDPAAPILESSAFAHGYLHGYEAGYHSGDQDFQIGHFRDEKELRQEKVPYGYKSQYGGKESFRHGFLEGFTAGYQDSAAGRDFAAVTMLRQLAERAIRQPSFFDEGFQNGYLAGKDRGAQAGQSDGDFDAVVESCPVAATSDQLRSYCDGYARAYMLGYRDGYLAEPQPFNTQLASGN